MVFACEGIGQSTVVKSECGFVDQNAAVGTSGRGRSYSLRWTVKSRSPGTQADTSVNPQPSIPSQAVERTWLVYIQLSQPGARFHPARRVQRTDERWNTIFARVGRLLLSRQLPHLFVFLHSRRPASDLMV